MLAIASQALSTVTSYISPAKTMIETESMEFYEARLKTFQGPRTTGRKRTSNARNGIGSKWNLASPSATQLAQAGFYFAPTAPDSDNVTCFCCEKSLDGWEEGDNPFSEHLHFSSDCAWAILMAVENNANEELQNEDPMSERMLEARRQTFRDQWPHERKRGWTCKIQKMVEGGWYFYPSSGADDQANCVYCKKSLLGWEPKDKPYDEHKKRSPDCAFFSASQAVPATKVRKTAASRATRASLQSEAASSIQLSESVDIHDDATQTSTMTVDTSTISTTSKAKKGTRTKKAAPKNAQPKNVAMPAETSEIQEAIPAPPIRSTRGKKRTSEQIQEESVEIVEPPKKRVTRAKAKTHAASRDPSPEPIDITMEDPEPSAVRSKKGAKGGRKRASSTTRKTSTRVASTRSVISQEASPPAVPTNDIIDAELAADLERFNSDDDSSDNWKVLGEDDSIVSQIFKPLPARTSIVRTHNVPARNETNSSVIEHHSNSAVDREVSLEVPSIVTSTSVQAVKTKPARKPKQAAKTKLKQQPAEQIDDALARKQFEESLEADDNEDFASALELRESSVQDEHIADASQLTVAAERDAPSQQVEKTKPTAKSAQPVDKNGQSNGKSTNLTQKASTKGKNAQKRSVEIAFQLHQDVDDADVAAELEALEAELGAQVSEIHQQDVPTLEVENAQDPTERQILQGSKQARGQVMSPEASPQSSDAENQPPSSRPSQTRPPLTGYSPTESRTIRVPLAPSTPSASPSKRNAGLQTTYPWTPANIDYILNGTPAANRENLDLRDLNTEEKKMTLEEWIKWNAKKNEDRLKADCEMMVGKFESEGVRALKTLEGIVSSDS